jgi:methylmalonyl-CoA/ethylmalonyl-CoA epimerase
VKGGRAVVSTGAPEWSSEGSVDPGVLHHIGIVVPAGAQGELAATLAGALDAHRVDGGEDEALDVRWEWLATPGSPILELLSPRSDRSTPVSDFVERTGGGLHHLSFLTDGLDTCRARLVDRGIAVTGYDPDHDGWSEFFLHPRTTFGALLHWMQPVSAQRIAEVGRIRSP